jgi:hypothetical protein
VSTGDRKVKDPAAVLDYLFRWGPSERNKDPWLDDGETIVSHNISVDPDGEGLTVEDSEVTNDAKDVLVWLTGGTNTVTYRVVCQIVTSLSRTDVRSMFLEVRKR